MIVGFGHDGELSVERKEVEGVQSINIRRKHSVAVFAVPHPPRGSCSAEKFSVDYGDYADYVGAPRHFDCTVNTMSNRPYDDAKRRREVQGMSSDSCSFNWQSVVTVIMVVWVIAAVP